MSSKEDILNAIRKNTGKKYDYPDRRLQTIKYPDVQQKFVEATQTAGAKIVLLEEGQDLNAVIREHYPDAKSVASNIPEVTCATFNPDQVATPMELDGTDVAVVRGELGVAENACIWIPQAVRHKALYFVSEALVILLDRTRLVHTMQDAYDRIADDQFNFGTFISGPSKTADIEQALVFGAHGARSVLVILC